MNDARQVVTVNGHRITLTHLDKVLYPETGTTKAAVLSYYASVAPALIRHAANRPATRKRWVHGVGTTENPGTVFFQKNLEERAPDWVHRLPIQHSDRVTLYPLVNDLATLTWLVQLSALEIHVPQWQFTRDGHAQNPDRLVLDLDPGPGVGLVDCAEIARLARSILTDMGLDSLPVTSGGKGIHLYAHLGGRYSADHVVLVAHELARALEADHPDRVVSGMSRALRPGKVFVDWSQNNAAKTTIAPYSLRGRSRPTVAAPRQWGELDSPALAQLELGEVVRRLERDGDPLKKIDTAGNEREGTAELVDSNDDRLSRYRAKRRADRTPEPIPAAKADTGTGTRTGAGTDTRAALSGTGSDAASGHSISGHSTSGHSTTGTSFVIHEHHARRLHWDLRLERDGVLVSWALPQGMPTDPARNHLAVHTEDHPLAYGSFAGTIPAGEYGAGRISIWDHGDYELEKWRQDEVIATLHGQPGGGLAVARRIALIHTGDGGGTDSKTAQNWLIHLMKPRSATPGARPPLVPRKPAFTRPLPDYIEPMLATAGSERDLGEDEWMFEMKWDGIRAIALVCAGDVRLVTRTGKDVTAAYPDIVAGLAAALPNNTAESAVLDGEIVALDSSSRPNFGLLQNRMNLSAVEARTAAVRAPAHYFLFDLLERNGQSLVEQSYDDRRAALARLLRSESAESARIQVPPALDGDYFAALRTSQTLGLEGIVAKRRDAPYRPGKRSNSWIKVKHTRTQAVVVGGWRPGTGNRRDTVGALLLGIPTEGGLNYVGRVGTGFSEHDLIAAHSLLLPLRVPASPFVNVPPADAHGATWVHPLLVGEVQFGEWTAGGRLRHPSWRGWRRDKRPTDVQRQPPGQGPPDHAAP